MGEFLTGKTITIEFFGDVSSGEIQINLDLYNEELLENLYLKQIKDILKQMIEKELIMKDEITLEKASDKTMILTQKFVIEQLKARIDKAIEYINNGYLSDGEMINILAQQDLLEILQGKSDE